MKERNNVLYQKMKENYDSLSDFLRRSGCPLSLETVRIAIYLGQEISHPALITLTKYLGFSPSEIREILKKSGDEIYWDLIGEDAVNLTTRHKALLTIYDSLKDRHVLDEIVEIMAKAEGLDVKKELRATKRGGKGKGKKGGGVRYGSV